MPETSLDGTPVRRSGQMGAFELAFFVVAAAGPLLVVVGYTPIAFMVGGVGAPGAQLAAGLVLLFFAVGLTRMALRIDNAGAFYAYIGRAFGRIPGAGSAALASGSYAVITAAEVIVIGYFASVLIPSVPWWAFSLLAWAIIAVISHHQISISAKVLGVALASEAGILLVLAVAILVIGGPEGVDLHSFKPSSIFAGNSTGAMFAVVFGAFLGFESTAIYTEEARDPRRTVPRAIYLAIGFLGVFYTFVAWTIYLAYGRSEIVLAAVTDPAGLVFGALEIYVGPWAVLLCEILIVISAFASALAFHNTAIRYLHTLGREGLLPTKLARVHPTHGSPSSANVVLALFTLIVVLGAALLQVEDPYLNLFIPVVSAGVVGLLTSQAVCALAIVFYFGFVDRTHQLSLWSTLIAPAIGFLGLASAVYLTVRNFDVLSGQSLAVNIALLSWLPILILIGLIRALVMRSSNPAAYARLTQTNVYQNH